MQSNPKTKHEAAIETGMIERAKAFLDIQSYGALIPETRRLWTAWLVGFAQKEKEIAGAASVSRRDVVEEALTNGPKHKFWGAGEPDCPPDLKAPNGELHTIRCKFCDYPKWTICIGQIEGD
jgi:hypothetical protein